MSDIEFETKLMNWNCMDDEKSKDQEKIDSMRLYKNIDNHHRDESDS